MPWKKTPNGPVWDDDVGFQTREEAENTPPQPTQPGAPQPLGAGPGNAQQNIANAAGADEDYYRGVREGLRPVDIAAEGERFGWHKSQGEDWTASNAARARMGQANALAYDAATGRVPSAAEMLARRQIDASRAAQVAMANSARGGANAQSAALMNAAQVGSQLQTQGDAQVRALRADEMAQAREDYLRGTAQEAQAANRSRGLSTQYASTLMGAHAQQRQTELEREGMYRGAEGGARQTRYGAIGQSGQQRAAERDADRNMRLQFAAAVGGMMIPRAGQPSDIRVKTEIQPEGGGKGAPAWLRAALGQQVDGPEGEKAKALTASAKPDGKRATPPKWLTNALGFSEGHVPQGGMNTEGDWQRAQMMLEEQSGEGQRKRAAYTQAIDEQNDLQAKRRAAQAFASIPYEQRSPFANDEYRDAFKDPGRYEGATLRRRMG